MFDLVYTNRAVKDIKKLPAGIKSRIGQTLSRYREDPLGYSEPLTNASLGTHRFRIGDYRVIFDLEGDDIVVLRVGHRKNIYRSL